MRLLVLTQSGEISGGANRSLIDVLGILKTTYKYDCFVLAPSEGDFTVSLSKMSIPYACVAYKETSYVRRNDIYDAYRFLKSVKDDAFNMKQVNAAIKVLNGQCFDYVYINDTANTFGYRIAKRLNIPYVWHFRGYNASIRKYMLFERDFVRKPNGKCIMISKAMFRYMQQYRHMNPNDMVVIYNGVVNKAKAVKQPWHNTIENGFHCLHCGHISEAKGQIDSIRAIGLLVKRGYRDIYLHIAGSDTMVHGKSYKDYLMEYIKDNNIVDNVIFEGEVKDMPELRQKMQVELMCSIAEPFGRVTVEGMQSGLVVIGSNTGATPEILKDGVTGCLYEQGNYGNLADKIAYVYDNREFGDMLSANALAYVSNHFTMEENVAQIERMFHRQGS